MAEFINWEAGMTVGLDLGDRFSHFCILSAKGEVVEEGRVATTRAALARRFSSEIPVAIVMEVGTHSPWVSRLLKSLGHTALVANARKLRWIFENRKKSDRVDARWLAKVGRFDVELLQTIEHRTEETAVDLSVLRSRDVLVRARTQLINHVRGATKAVGERISRGSPGAFHRTALKQLPPVLQNSLASVLDAIGSLTEQIGELDQRIEDLGATKYADTRLLRQVDGVGPLISLAFILTLATPQRFARSRDVGAYLGLVPARSQSGKSDPQQRITKEGDPFLRRLLVQAAQRILGPFGKECNLRQFGLNLAARGGKNAKRRAVVAVARKLAILLHHLWTTGEVYEPLYPVVQAAA